MEVEIGGVGITYSLGLLLRRIELGDVSRIFQKGYSEAEGEERGSYHSTLAQ